MLVGAPAQASLVICSTCRFSAGNRDDEEGKRGGEVFAGHLRKALAGHACEGRLELQRMPCLFACSSHCTAFLRSGVRLSYILGNFAPTEGAALALLDFAACYLESHGGVVPYADWPAGVKGHFLVRIPPQDSVWDPSSLREIAQLDIPEAEAQ